MLIFLFIEMAVAIGAIAALALFPFRAKWALSIQICATALIILALSLGGIWMIWWLPAAFWAAFSAATVTVLLKSRRRAVARSSRAVIALAMLHIVLGLAGGYYAVAAWAGRTAPDVNSVDLHFPLEGGSYYILNGGFSENINAHIRTLARETPGQRAYYGQSYSVDIVGLGPWGTVSDGMLPSDPRRYVIFGEPVLAPCAGSVIGKADGLPDMRVPEADRDHMAGNHVVLRCDEVDILLAHMTPDSIGVAIGDRVAVGDQLGNVGNSGNTNMPHLHIHAQTPGTAAEPFSGDPLPIRFDGRFFFRGDRL